ILRRGSFPTNQESFAQPASDVKRPFCGLKGGALSRCRKVPCRPGWPQLKSCCPHTKQISMAARLFRFGLFELNTGTRQLHKQGRRIRLQEQPLRVLEILLERPGELVSREELRQRLWP